MDEIRMIITEHTRKLLEDAGYELELTDPEPEHFVELFDEEALQKLRDDAN